MQDNVEAGLAMFDKVVDSWYKHIAAVKAAFSDEIASMSGALAAEVRGVSVVCIAMVACQSWDILLATARTKACRRGCAFLGHLRTLALAFSPQEPKKDWRSGGFPAAEKFQFITLAVCI
jgi:hypothetical protein